MNVNYKGVFFQLFVEYVNNKFLKKSMENSSLWSLVMIYNASRQEQH